MGRIIGIDFGKSKTGISLSDPLKIIASDYEVIFKKCNNEKYSRIKEICLEKDVEKIVLGLPLNMNGSHGFQADEVTAFAEQLKRLNIPIFFIDERLSTKKAEDTMKEMKMSREEIALKSDAKAASVILQEYLDYFL